MHKCYDVASPRCFGASANMNFSRYASASTRPTSSSVQASVGRLCSSTIRPYSQQQTIRQHCRSQWSSGKGKVKVHTLDIAPLRSESPPQKRSGMACVLEGFHSFTCTPTRSSAIGMSHTYLCLPSRSWYSFTDPRWMEG